MISINNCNAALFLANEKNILFKDKLVTISETKCSDSMKEVHADSLGSKDSFGSVHRNGEMSKSFDMRKDSFFGVAGSSVKSHDLVLVY